MEGRGRDRKSVGGGRDQAPLWGRDRSVSVARAAVLTGWRVSVCVILSWLLEHADFALRCLRGVLQQCEERGEQDGCHKEPGAKRAKPHAVGLGGLVFATCCHHRCSWDSYCGRGYLEGCGLTDVDFCLITKMSSWAVCGCRPQQQEEDDRHSTLSSDEDDQVESPQSREACQKGEPHSATSQGYSPHPKEAIGLLCKRLIDEGRVWFLRQLGLQAGLVAYVERDVSLENVLITATTAERTQQQDD